jgi:hypothetical protein
VTENSKLARGTQAPGMITFSPDEKPYALAFARVFPRLGRDN